MLFFCEDRATEASVRITEEGQLMLADDVTHDDAMQLIYRRVGELLRRDFDHARPEVRKKRVWPCLTPEERK